MEFKDSFAELLCDFFSFFSAYLSLQSYYLIQHLSCQTSLRTLLSLDVSFPFKGEHTALLRGLGDSTSAAECHLSGYRLTNNKPRRIMELERRKM